MKKALALILAVMMLFCLSACEGYDTPSKAVEAYFNAYATNDYEGVLECYPEASRSYFLQAEGGEESFAANVAAISEAGTTQYQIVREEPITDLTAVDRALEDIGDVFEYTEASAVILKTYITFADGTTYPEDITKIEETQMVTVKVDGKWYIFADMLYSDDTSDEGTDDQ